MADGAPDRFHGIDAARAAAMLVSTVMHAACAYMVVPVAGGLWHVNDTDTWRGADVIVWWVRAFDIQLFLLMSGFLAARAFESRGPRDFLATRVRRIGVPFVAACVIVLPLVYLVWANEWVQAGRATWQEVLTFKFQDKALKRTIAGPAHLWFLEHLLVLCVLYLLVRVSWARISASRRASIAGSAFARGLDRFLLSPFGFLVPTAASVLFLWADPKKYAASVHSFVPYPSLLAFYGTYFVYGCWLARHAADLGRFAGRGFVHLPLAVPALVWLLHLVSTHPDGVFHGTDRLAVAVAGSLVATFMVFGLFGLFLRFATKPSAVVRGISDSAFWVYLIHLPVVGAFQSILRNVDLPGFVKFLLVVFATYPVCVLTYRFRPAWLGALLGAPRTKPPPATDPAVTARAP